MKKSIRPIYLINESGVDPRDIEAVKNGIKTILEIADVENEIKIYDKGVWRDKDYINPVGSLKEYDSVDWYIQEGKIKSRNSTKLNADEILNKITYRLFEEGTKNYYIVIVESDIYSEELNTNFMVGLAREGCGSVISTYRFKSLETDPNQKYEVIKTEAMHELGHVFGIPNENERRNLIKSLGGHCSNVCVMRQGLCSPYDWIKITYDRLESGKQLCEECINDLKTYFGRK